MAKLRYAQVLVDKSLSLQQPFVQESVKNPLVGTLTPTNILFQTHRRAAEKHWGVRSQALACTKLNQELASFFVCPCVHYGFSLRPA
jgi:hypothetical protein